jgi:hypothetical protein
MTKHATIAALLLMTSTTTLCAQPLRLATFNVSMEALNYLERGQVPNGGELSEQLKSNNQQIQNIAEIIQRVRPEILLLNEFDYIPEQANGIGYFIKHYLNVGQYDAKAINYPYVYLAPVNTGVPTPFDLNRDGKKSHSQNDAYGFGFFPGHFGMVLLSQHPIDFDKVRTFQHFLWKDMPGAQKTTIPGTTDNWYSDQAWQQFRLSSKSHWDIPVKVNGKTLHIIAAHPTPPVFDGEEDRNGKRNFDEIRFLNDYISPNTGSYIYDDQKLAGNLAENKRFVIMGDLNASTDEGDAIREGIAGLLNNPLINASFKPQSQGGAMHQIDNPLAKYHTAHWGMRADYVLPSSYGFKVKGGGVFWPEPESELFRLVKNRAASSDHRLVYMDLHITD